jgi:general secretion pathway protein J
MLNGFDLDSKKGKSENEPAILLDQIEEGRFEFRTIDENGELTDWSDKWEDPAITPVMVRIVVRMLPEARIDFPEMEIALMLDAGAARRPLNGQNPGKRGLGAALGSKQ